MRVRTKICWNHLGSKRTGKRLITQAIFSSSPLLKKKSFSFPSVNRKEGRQQIPLNYCILPHVHLVVKHWHVDTQLLFFPFSAHETGTNTCVSSSQDLRFSSQLYCSVDSVFRHSACLFRRICITCVWFLLFRSLPFFAFSHLPGIYRRSFQLFVRRGATALESISSSMTFEMCSKTSKMIHSPMMVRRYTRIKFRTWRVGPRRLLVSVGVLIVGLLGEDTKQH